MSRRPDLTGQAYRRQRANLIATSNGICWICHTPINLDLPGTHPAGPTLDHITPISRGGHPTHPHNQALAHQHCNSSRGNRPPKPPTPHSRQW